jgi:hypothetical protein
VIEWPFGARDPRDLEQPQLHTPAAVAQLGIVRSSLLTVCSRLDIGQ